MAVGPLVVAQRVHGRGVDAVEDVDDVGADGLVGALAMAVLGVTGEDREIHVVVVHRPDGLILHGSLGGGVVRIEVVTPQGHLQLVAFVMVPIDSGRTDIAVGTS